MEIAKKLNNLNFRRNLLLSMSIDDFSNNEREGIAHFIRESLEKKKHIEDIFSLSILINFYTEKHVLIASEMLNKRTSYYLKLTILDYLLENFKKINKEDFYRLNEIALNNSNLLVRFQAKLNLVCLTRETSYFMVIENFPTSTFYYRFANSLINSFKLRKIFEVFLAKIILNVNVSHNINVEQKKDLENMIMQIRGNFKGPS